MALRRLLAGIVLTMLLSATSAGAACEISCGFAQGGSDCHSPMALSGSADQSASQMDGMDMSMSAMQLPDDSNNDGMATIPALGPLQAGHLAIDEMGPCERQSCDERSVASVRPAYSFIQQLHANTFVVKMPQIAPTTAFFHDARDDVSFHRARDASSPVIILRI